MKIYCTKDEFLHMLLMCNQHDCERGCVLEDCCVEDNNGIHFNTDVIKIIDED